MDAGYDAARLAWLLGDLPVQLVARVRSDRGLHPPASPVKRPTAGRPRRHGDRLKLVDPTTWPPPQARAADGTVEGSQQATPSGPQVGHGVEPVP